jgi:transposase-like protein
MKVGSPPFAIKSPRKWRPTARQCGRDKPHHKPKLTPHQKQEAIRRRVQGEAVREIARSYNVSATTISRLPS